MKMVPGFPHAGLGAFASRIGRTMRERLRLRRVATVPCNTATLGVSQGLGLRDAFHCKQYDEEWETVAAELAQLAIPQDTGGVNPGDGRAIYYLVRHLRPRTVLEVGTHIGASTVHIGAALRALHRLDTGTSRKLVTVDIVDVNGPQSAWAHLESRYSPTTMIARLGCDGLASFVTARSLDYLATCAEKYDLIFLDGDHKAPTVYREIPAALLVLNPGGRILLHDYFPSLKALWSDGVVIPGPYLATERLRQEGAEIVVLPFSAVPWPTKMNSKVTSLGLLTRSGASNDGPVA